MEQNQDYSVVVSEQNNNLIDLNGDALFIMAEQAEKRINAIRKVISASLSMTNEMDWCLISGTPYLQETGAGKVARLFGVSWRIGKPDIEVDERGYKTFIFKGEFSFQGQSIECEGSRSMKEDFFSRKKDGMKTPDEIDERDVRQAAYTNCINNGIKRIIPGLRNTTLETLEQAGLDVSKIKGYDFKKGSKGGAKQEEGSESLLCEVCGESISATVAEYSKKSYGKCLCMKHQKELKAASSKAE